MATRKQPQRNSGGDRRMLYVLFAILILVALVIVSRKYSSTPSLVSSDQGIAPDILGGISREGKGGDPELNLQKNRTSEPTKLEEYTPAGIIGLKHTLLDLEGAKHRVRWSADARTYAASMESIGARLTGYLIAAKQSGIESCNGDIDSLRDFHIWIGDSPDAVKMESVIVEMTPRWKEIHPEWRLRYLERLAMAHAKVRVTGWIMWDEEHASEVDKSRGTQWEVHPVTKFEVFTNGSWRGLDGTTLPAG